MKRTKLILILLFFVASLPLVGQEFKLLPANVGIDMVYGKGITKDSIINYTKFAEGEDKLVDILRFDNVGTGAGSDIVLISSSKEPVQVDYFGLTPLKLNVDTLKNLIDFIQQLDTKIYLRPSGHIAFRMTYRFGGEVYQYFVSNPKESTEYFKKVEQRIIGMNNDEALKKYYHFLWTTPLLKKRSDGIQTYSPRGKIDWEY